MVSGPTATDRAYAHTKARILDGRLRGGELLTEGEVADLVGLSRTPVREAFLRLEGEGLLRLYPKRGALVVPVSAAEVEDVMETRLLVERHAIERVGRASPDLATRLERSLAKQKQLAAAGRGPAFVEADRAFHRILVGSTGNDVLLALYDSLRDRQSRMGLVALSRDPDRLRQILSEHRALVDAVAVGDPAAGTILERHLNGSLALLRSGPPGNAERTDG